MLSLLGTSCKLSRSIEKAAKITFYIDRQEQNWTVDLESCSFENICVGFNGVK